MRLLPICVLLGLCGCMDSRPVQDTPQTMPVIRTEPTLGRDDVAGIVRTETTASSNAIQQNTQALLGASIGKLAERVDAALAKVETNLSMRVDAQANASATLLTSLKAELKAELNLAAKIDTQATAIAAVEARINARLDAMGTAQGAAVAGLGNKLSETVQKFDAGRDVNSTEFTPNMADVFERAFKSMVSTVYIMAGALVSILGGATVIINRTKEASRQRAEERANGLQNVLFGGTVLKKGVIGEKQ